MYPHFMLLAISEWGVRRRKEVRGVENGEWGGVDGK